MKKHLSVLGLFIRSSILPVLGILLLMGVVEFMFFHMELQSALTAYDAGIGAGFPQLERMLAKSAAYVYFALAFVLITILLCLPGCEFRAKTGYTLCRLSISEKSVFLWQFVCNTLMYVLLAAVQTVIAYGLCQYYMASAPAALTSNQTVFLAFWRSEFLHTLLPLTDITLWIRNILLALSLGLATALFPYKQRQKLFSGSAIALVSFTIVFFERGIGDIGHTVIAAIIGFMVVCELLGFVLTKDREEVTEDE